MKQFVLPVFINVAESAVGLKVGEPFTPVVDFRLTKRTTRVLIEGLYFIHKWVNNATILFQFFQGKSFVLKTIN